MGWLILAGLGFAALLAASSGPKPGDKIIIRARDGSSHRLVFVVAINTGTGRKASGWVAESSDTANRFQDGEIVNIAGSRYAWKSSAVEGPGRQGVGGAFLKA